MLPVSPCKQKANGTIFDSSAMQKHAGWLVTQATIDGVLSECQPGSIAGHGLVLYGLRTVVRSELA